MSNLPGPLDDSAVVDHALVGALTGSTIGGLGLSLASAFLGGVGTHFARQYGFVGASLAGSVSVGFCSLVLLRIFMDHLTPRIVLACFLASGLVAAAMNWWIGARLEWAFFRWALAGAAIGTCGGAIYGPIYLAKGGTLPRGNPLHRGREALILALALGLAAIIKAISRAAAGAILAGIAGGAVGGLFTSLLAVLVGRQDDLKELMGSVTALPLFGVILGASGGGWGGLQAWWLRDKLGQTSLTASETMVSAEQSAVTDRPRE